MEAKIIESLLQNGPFAVLFVWLLFKVLKDSKEREAKLTDLIERMAPTLEKLEQDVSDIKDTIDKQISK